MNTKLVLVEGIPGSGKTTFAGKIKDWLADQGQAVNLYLEGAAHPADLAWTARLCQKDYEEMLRRYEKHTPAIQSQTHWEEGFALVSYTQLQNIPFAFYEEMAAYEVYDLRSTPEEFCRLHQQRWKTFGQKAAREPRITLFECAFFQNQLNELLLWHRAEEADIYPHLSGLLGLVSALAPVLVYLAPSDIAATVQRIAVSRVSEYGNWIDQCIAYCENTPYGKAKGLSGREGVLDVFQLRREMECRLLPRLGIPYTIVSYEDGNWAAAWADITAFLQTC